MTEKLENFDKIYKYLTCSICGQHNRKLTKIQYEKIADKNNFEYYPGIDKLLFVRLNNSTLHYYSIQDLPGCNRCWIKFYNHLINLAYKGVYICQKKT